MATAFRRLRGIFTNSRPAPSRSQPQPSHASQSHLTKVKKLKAIIQNPYGGVLSKSYRVFDRIYASTVLELPINEQFSLIEDLLTEFKRFHHSNEGLTDHLISLYGRLGMFDQARELFDKMPELNCKRTIKSVNALLNASVESKRFDKVEDLFKELPEQCSVDINMVTYNTIIKAYCRMGSLDSAISMLDQLIEKGFVPNIITFHILLTALCTTGRFTEVEKIWGLMESKQISPDSYIYAVKMRAMVSQNKLSEAAELFSEMTSRKIEPSISCFNVFIYGFSLSGDVKEAKNWYQKLVESKRSPNPSTMRMIIPLLIENGELEMARNLCIEAINKRIRIGRDLMQSVVNKLVSDSKVEQAKALVGLCSSDSTSGIRYYLQLPSAEH